MHSLTAPSTIVCIMYFLSAWIYQWTFLYGPVWFLIVFLAISMALVYRTVLQQERKVSRWTSPTPRTVTSTTPVAGTRPGPSTSGLFKSLQSLGSMAAATLSSSRRLKHSKRVANQGLLYVLAFLATWFFGTLTRILDLAKNRTYFPIVILHVFFLPCQGFFNFLVYLRPRYLRHIKKHPENRPSKVVMRGITRISSITHISSLRGSASRKGAGEDEEEEEESVFVDEDYCALPPESLANISSNIKAQHEQKKKDAKQSERFVENDA